MNLASDSTRQSWCLGLRKRREFLSAAKGKKQVKTGFILQANARHEAPPEAIGIGFTASRKVGGAVQRNRAKRRLRAVWHQAARAHTHGATDYVLIARRAVLTMPFAQLLGDLERALKALGKSLDREFSNSAGQQPS